MLTQLNKLNKLVEQLQEKESGYLGQLLQLMVRDHCVHRKNNDTEVYMFVVFFFHFVSYAGYGLFCNGRK